MKWLWQKLVEESTSNLLNSPEKYNFEKDSLSLKYEFVKQVKRNDSKIIIIDDDPAILKKIKDGCDDVILLKDTTLID